MTKTKNTIQELSFTLKELTDGMQTFIDMKKNSIYHYQGLTQQEMVCLVLTEFLSFSKKEQDEKNKRYQEYLKLKAEFEGTEAALVVKEQPKDNLWYPDDSGEWVEVIENSDTIPDDLESEDKVHYLLKGERNNKYYREYTVEAAYCNFSLDTDHENRIVAYKKVK